MKVRPDSRRPKNPKRPASIAHLHEIRQVFRVPAYKWGRVEIGGKKGSITGSVGPFLRVKLDEDQASGLHHPTIGVKYEERKALGVRNKAFTSDVVIDGRLHITLIEAAKLLGVTPGKLLARLQNDGVSTVFIHSSFIDTSEFKRWLEGLQKEEQVDDERRAE